MPDELLVSRHGGQLWVALRERGRTWEIQVEFLADDRPRVGRVLRGRVVKVLAGIQCAFLDVGLDREVCLHAADLRLPGDPSPAPGDRGRDPLPPIQDRLNPGRDLVVQVVREAVGAKVARVSSVLAFSGRLLVMRPADSRRAISRRIRHDPERVRLLRIVDELPGAAETGYVLRTASAGASASALGAEARGLIEEWTQVAATIESTTGIGVLHREPPLVTRALREAPPTVARVVFDDVADRDEARRHLAEVDPMLASRIELHTGEASLYDSFELARDVERAMRSRVWLPSGGSLSIEETDALVAIDVNSGKLVGAPDPRQTALRCNLEAAEEIPRQLCLRNLGGIVVIDFIDMRRADRGEVTRALEQALEDDNARSRVRGWTELDLLQLTRERSRPTLASELGRPCPQCGGRGRELHLPEGRG